MSGPVERPIIFSGPMVRALVAGRKTQTRRLVRVPSIVAAEPDDVDEPGERWDYTSIDQRDDGVWRAWMTEYPEEGSVTVRPPARPGDRLWVRETWNQFLLEPRFIYRADHSDPARLSWKSPYHMRRTASRLTLEVTEVRAQRLQDISEEDAMAEGLTPRSWCGPAEFTFETGRCVFGRAGAVFRAVWDEINGKRAPWADNPWVWVVTFRVAK